MTQQEATNAIQSHIGDTVLAINITRDNDGDWIADIVPNDNDGSIIGSASMAAHGRAAPQVCWD